MIELKKLSISQNRAESALKKKKKFYHDRYQIFLRIFVPALDFLPSVGLKDD